MCTVSNIHLHGGATPAPFFSTIMEPLERIYHSKVARVALQIFSTIGATLSALVFITTGNTLAGIASIGLGVAAIFLDSRPITISSIVHDQLYRTPMFTPRYDICCDVPQRRPWTPPRLHRTYEMDPVFSSERSERVHVGDHSSSSMDDEERVPIRRRS